MGYIVRAVLNAFDLTEAGAQRAILAAGWSSND